MSASINSPHVHGKARQPTPRHCPKLYLHRAAGWYPSNPPQGTPPLCARCQTRDERASTVVVRIAPVGHLASRLPSVVRAVVASSAPHPPRATHSAPRRAARPSQHTWPVAACSPRAKVNAVAVRHVASPGTSVLPPGGGAHLRSCEASWAAAAGAGAFPSQPAPIQIHIPHTAAAVRAPTVAYASTAQRVSLGAQAAGTGHTEGAVVGGVMREQAP